jgi:hypothetical protein
MASKNGKIRQQQAIFRSHVALYETNHQCAPKDSQLHAKTCGQGIAFHPQSGLIKLHPLRIEVLI